jgi:hypothetical protein
MRFIQMFIPMINRCRQPKLPSSDRSKYQAEAADAVDGPDHERNSFGLPSHCIMSPRQFKKLRVIVLMQAELMPPETLDGVEDKRSQPWRTEYDVVSTLRAM